MLFGCYRRGDANDPDTYVAAVAAVLARYDTDLVREVTDPNTGIQTSEKYMTFMPNAGELKVYCEGMAARRERVQRLGALPAPDFNRPRLAPPEPRPGDKATVFVPESHQRYHELIAWSKIGDPRLWKIGRSSDARVGIWIGWEIWDDRRTLVGRSIGGAAATVAKDVAPTIPDDQRPAVRQEVVG